MQERTSGSSEGAVEAEQAKEPELELADEVAAATQAQPEANPLAQADDIADDIADDDSEAAAPTASKSGLQTDAAGDARGDELGGPADSLHRYGVPNTASEATADIHFEVTEGAPDGATAAEASPSASLAAEGDSAAATSRPVEDDVFPDPDVALADESVDVAIETEADAQEPQTFAAEAASASTEVASTEVARAQAVASEDAGRNGSEGGNDIALVDAVTAALDAERARAGDAQANQAVPDPMSPWDIGAIVLKAGDVSGSARANAARDADVDASADAVFEAPDDGPTTLGEDAEPMILADERETSNDERPPSDDTSVLDRGDTVIAPLPPEFLAATAATVPATDSPIAPAWAAAAPATPNPKLSRTLPPPSRLSGTASHLRIPTPAPVVIEAARRSTPPTSPGAVPAPKKPGRTILGLGLADILDLPALARRAGATAKGKKVSTQRKAGHARAEARPRANRGTTTAAFGAHARAQLRRAARSARVLANRVQVTTLTLSSMIAATFVGGLLVGRAVWNSPSDVSVPPPVATVSAPLGSVPTVLPIQPTTSTTSSGATTTPGETSAPSAGNAAGGTNIGATQPAGSASAAAAHGQQAPVAAAPSLPAPSLGSITIVPTVSQAAAPAAPAPPLPTRARASRPRRSPSIASSDPMLATSSRASAAGRETSEMTTTVARSAPAPKAQPKRKYTWVDPFAD